MIQNHIAAQQLLNLTGINADKYIPEQQIQIAQTSADESTDSDDSSDDEVLGAIEDEESEDFDEKESDESKTED